MTVRTALVRLAKSGSGLVNVCVCVGGGGGGDKRKRSKDDARPSGAVAGPTQRVA